VRALLLWGSPREEASNSWAVGRYALSGLKERGWVVEELAIVDALVSAQGIDDMMAATEGADLLVLSFPVHFNSPPAPVIRFMEVFREHRKGGCALIALACWAMSPPSEDSVPLAICRLFARDCDLKWRGGLMVGGTDLIENRPLCSTDLVTGRIKRALDLALDALAEGGAIPPEAVDLMNGRGSTTFMYITRWNMEWRKRARMRGTLDRIRERPYMEETR
jgi:hypothetical protein